MTTVYRGSSAVASLVSSSCDDAVNLLYRLGEIEKGLELPGVLLRDRVILLLEPLEAVIDRIEVPEHVLGASRRDVDSPAA